MPYRNLCKTLLGVIFFAFFPLGTLAQTAFTDKESTQYREGIVKAGYIFNIAKYTQWPSTQMENIVLCLDRGDSMFDFMKDMNSKNVFESTKFYVERRDLNQESNLNNCGMVFISHSYTNKKKLLKTLKSLPILTISDSNEFINEGGMIGLVNKKGNIKLEINVERMSSEGFSANPKLIAVASKVLR